MDTIAGLVVGVLLGEFLYGVGEMRKALIRKADGFVENVIETEEGANWKAPDGCILIDAFDASSGDTWDGTKFLKPEPEPTKLPRDLEAEITKLEARISALEVKIK